MGYRTSTTDLVKNLEDAKEHLTGANDYALFSLLYVEHANQKTMINKQVMKSTIVNIGFAVISVGMLLIILGIRDETGSGQGAQAGGEVGGIKFDFTTGSTGVAMFMVGAIMATIGGVLKNEYTTSTIPNYESMAFAHPQYEESLQAYQACAADKKNFDACFTQIFFQINQARLQ